jgi:hypothetical protein
MNETILTLIRAVLKVGGGFLVAHGLADDSSVETIIAGVLAVIGIVWGIMHRNNSGSGSKAGITPCFLLPALILAGLCTGCDTPQRTTYNTALTTQTSVEAAMSGWNVYVGQYHPTVETEKQVKALFDTYRAAELVTIDATRAWFANTNDVTRYTDMMQAQAAQTQAQSKLINGIAIVTAYTTATATNK